MTLRHLPLTVREIHATEKNLDALYAAAYMGLSGDSMALAAGLLPAEYRTLASMDPLVDLAEAKARADAERALAGVVHEAAMGGDAKMALEVLKHKYGWVAKTQVQVDVAQQISIISALDLAQTRVIEGTARLVKDVN
jgi:hypothetical protein